MQKAFPRKIARPFYNLCTFGRVYRNFPETAASQKTLILLRLEGKYQGHRLPASTKMRIGARIGNDEHDSQGDLPERAASSKITVNSR